ncbi:hypothetical protein PUN4_150120 [Paraburkholderia unamae]|nr:hypothetical protein PUN4_150120 [Paraburkholderia unamae]
MWYVSNFSGGWMCWIFIVRCQFINWMVFDIIIAFQYILKSKITLFRTPASAGPQPVAAGLAPI